MTMCYTRDRVFYENGIRMALNIEQRCMCVGFAVAVAVAVLDQQLR